VKLLEGWQDARPSCAYQTAQAPLRDALLCAGLFDLNSRCKQFAAGQPQARPAGLDLRPYVRRPDMQACHQWHWPA